MPDVFWGFVVFFCLFVCLFFVCLFLFFLVELRVGQNLALGALSGARCSLDMFFMPGSFHFLKIYSILFKC